MINMIVAHDLNRLIGAENKLPWNIKEDLKFFKDYTMGRKIVMGRKTFESIGVLLPGRESIVLSTDKNYKQEGVKIYNNLPQLLKSEIDGFVVIGGSEIYKQLLPFTDFLVVTEVQEEFKGDSYFPEYLHLFEEVYSSPEIKTESGLKIKVMNLGNNKTFRK